MTRHLTAWLLLLTLNVSAASAFDPTEADRRTLSEISAAMTQIRTLKADFEQTAPDGTVTSGVFTMRRPGKARFDYASPSPIRVISDGFWVAVEDTARRSQDRFPLSGTPLALLLSDAPSFESKKVRLEQVERTDNGIEVSVRDAEASDQGVLTLRFALSPITLQGWDVLDAQGQRTRVQVSNVRTGVTTENRAFFIEDLRERQ